VGRLAKKRNQDWVMVLDEEKKRDRHEGRGEVNWVFARNGPSGLTAQSRAMHVTWGRGGGWRRLG